MLSTHYRDHLTPAEQRAYDAVTEGLCRREAEICFPKTKDPFRVVSAVNYDNPFLFYVNWVESIKIRYNCIHVFWNPPYIYSPEEITRITAEMDSLARAIPGISAEGKVRGIHDWFIEHITYDRAGLKQPIRSPGMFNATGPLLHRTAVCEGVSKLACYLMRRMGLDASMVVGRSGDGMHAWNAVSIRGEIRYLDITYDIGLSRGGRVSDRYLLLTEEQMAKDHTQMFI